jgi:RNA polymerase sigma-70 factor (ECF subfamily)
MYEQELIPHLFRTEFSKISSVLTKLLGIEHLEIAEDIASETFLAALETWPYQGIPPTLLPGCILLQKNKTKNYLHRNKVFSEKIIPGIQN